jgi:hypothetical protein
MNANGPDLFRAGALRLRVLADGPDALHLLCEGDVSLPEWQPGDDPLAEFFGPGVYGRKVLLKLDKVGSLDTTVTCVSSMALASSAWNGAHWCGLFAHVANTSRPAAGTGGLVPGRGHGRLQASRQSDGLETSSRKSHTGPTSPALRRGG